VPHATAALHLICLALDLRPGDEVIAPDVTWVASVAPIVYTGATPVLVDIDPVTWCIDPAAVEAAITPRRTRRSWASTATARCAIGGRFAPSPPGTGWR
jgi:dTDP-4-amino-4,6-dideoxygalactose transaminase